MSYSLFFLTDRSQFHCTISHAYPYFLYVLQCSVQHLNNLQTIGRDLHTIIFKIVSIFVSCLIYSIRICAKRNRIYTFLYFHKTFFEMTTATLSRSLAYIFVV